MALIPDERGVMFSGSAILDDKNLLTIKALLTAFIQKCYENYEQKNELSSILGNIDKALTHDKSI